MNYQQLADWLFPTVETTIDELEQRFPHRDLADGAMITRLGPSPTGFIHIGNLYGAMIDERMAHQSGGSFLLRIEDTDDKRKVEGAEALIIRAMEYFGIHFDEGVTLDGDKGAYGPYHQSERVDIYQAVAKSLVAQGKAIHPLQRKRTWRRFVKNRKPSRSTLVTTASGRPTVN